MLTVLTAFPDLSTTAMVWTNAAIARAGQIKIDKQRYYVQFELVDESRPRSVLE